ncbi:hypothetical protein [Methanoculleus thermophilus]|uniref:Chlor_Arch_YYY domain-containing protein n=1 Tax=Methanoculleus thermophilus TaxID=2200 RepID=A0A1G9B946_9EURY|nr:hypothetical protein [Methanoculleus thermophilus]SDK36061.1 hypothetical protein SAMN04488571_10873 [Methanoculleus thermophilus]
MKIRLFENLANIFPYLLILAYIAGCIFCLLIDRIGYLINGSIMAVPAILGSFMFILMKKKDLDFSNKTEVYFSNPSTSVMLFSLFYVFTILAFLMTPAGSNWGLLTILILYAIIFIQILSRRLVPAVVLLEIMLSLTATIYNYTLRPALYFGWTDILPHTYMSTVTYLSGHVIPGELGNYTYFPLYHVFVAISSHILGLDIQTSLFIITGLVFSSTVLFLYYLVNVIFHDEQISLIIALMYAMNADVIYYGTYMVTRTMAYVGFLILLYLLYSLTTSEADARYSTVKPTARKVLVVITVFFMLLVHQISTPMIIVLLGLLFVFELYTHNKIHVTPAFLMVPISLCASYWLFIAYSFLGELAPRTDLSLYQNIAFTDALHHLGLSFLMNNIDTILIVFFALAGAIYLIWKQQPRYSVVLGVLGFLAILLNVPNILSTVFQLVEILRIDRYALLFLPFLAVAMGFGLSIFSRYLTAGRIPIRVVGILLIALVVLYGIGSLGLIKVESDELSYTRDSFNQDEVVGFDHVLKTVPSGSSLYSDHYTSRFFERGKFDQSERLGLPYYISYWMNNDLKTPEESGYIILLENQFQHGGLVFGKGNELDPENIQPYLPTEENVQKIARKLSVEDKIYSNVGVDLYYFSN